jgi:hypothetical protein
MDWDGPGSDEGLLVCRDCEIDDLRAEVATLRAQFDKVRAAIAPQCLECLTGEHEALTAHEVYRR